MEASAVVVVADKEDFDEGVDILKSTAVDFRSSLKCMDDKDGVLVAGGQDMGRRFNTSLSSFTWYPDIVVAGAAIFSRGAIMGLK